MNFLNVSRIAMACATAALSTVPPAAAQTGELPGRMVTRGFAPLPSPLTAVVEPQDDTDENVALARRFAEEIAKRGGKADNAGAPLSFYFATEVRANVRAAPPRPTPAPSEAAGSAAADADPARSSGLAPPPPATGAPAGGGARVLSGRPEGRDYGRSLRYVINATIDDKRDGKRLWQGHISYDGAEPDRKAIFSALVPLLVVEIGKTIQERRFAFE